MQKLTHFCNNNLSSTEMNWCFSPYKVSSRYQKHCIYTYQHYEATDMLSCDYQTDHVQIIIPVTHKHNVYDEFVIYETFTEWVYFMS